MMVRRVLIQNHDILVGGSGYAHEGGLTCEAAQGDATAVAAASAIIRCGLPCNDAALRTGGGQWKVGGHPLEGPLEDLAMKSRRTPDPLRQNRYHPDKQTIPH